MRVRLVQARGGAQGNLGPRGTAKSCCCHQRARLGRAAEGFPTRCMPSALDLGNVVPAFAPSPPHVFTSFVTSNAATLSCRIVAGDRGSPAEGSTEAHTLSHRLPCAARGSRMS